VKRAHVSAMSELPFARIVVLAAVLAAAAAVAGCTTTDTSGTSSGGGYSGKGSRGGGWDNFRAEAPAPPGSMT
jgi:uncharacterized membrane protein